VVAAAIGSTLIIATGRRVGRAAPKAGPAASLPSGAP
jgi:hypothetical protein